MLENFFFVFPYVLLILEQLRGHFSPFQAVAAALA